MNDRELLEPAAKAAGLRLSEYQTSQEGAPLWLDREHANPVTHSRDWNPLTDDGDALRLAVKLHLFVVVEGDQDADIARRTKVGHLTIGSKCELHGSDPYAATRRAIVRAAAEIGKAMP